MIVSNQRPSCAHATEPCPPSRPIRTAPCSGARRAPRDAVRNRTAPHPPQCAHWGTSAEGCQLRQHSCRTGDKTHNSPPRGKARGRGNGFFASLRMTGGEAVRVAGGQWPPLHSASPIAYCLFNNCLPSRPLVTGDWFLVTGPRILRFAQNDRRENAFHGAHCAPLPNPVPCTPVSPIAYCLMPGLSHARFRRFFVMYQVRK